MRNIMILTSTLLLSAGFSFANDLQKYVGKWAFDDLNPKKAKCFEITTDVLKSKKKLLKNCRKSRGGGYAQDKKEHPLSCSHAQEGILITDTESGCEKQLEAELQNGH